MPNTIPIPKAVKTRLGNETCFLAIIFNITRKTSNTMTLITVKSISISIYSSFLIFSIPTYVIRIKGVKKKFKLLIYSFQIHLKLNRVKVITRTMKNEKFMFIRKVSKEDVKRFILIKKTRAIML